MQGAGEWAEKNGLATAVRDADGNPVSCRSGSLNYVFYRFSEEILEKLDRDGLRAYSEAYDARCGEVSALLDAGRKTREQTEKTERDLLEFRRRTG